MRVNNKMNSVAHKENDNETSKTKHNNIHEHFISLANKTFLDIPSKTQSDKKRNKIRNNINIGNTVNNATKEIDNEMFYENFMEKLNIKKSSKDNDNEFFCKKTFSNSQNNNVVSKTPKLLSAKKIIPFQQQNNHSYNNSIHSLKSSKVYFNQKNTIVNENKKGIQPSFKFTHSPYLGSIQNGTRSGRLSPRSLSGKNGFLKLNNNVSAKVKSSSFSPGDKNQIPIKNEVLKIFSGQSDKHNIRNSNPPVNANNNNNNKNNKNKKPGYALMTSKTQKMGNENIKGKKGNKNNVNKVKVLGNIILTEDKEEKKKNKFNFCGCLLRKEP